MSERRIPVSEHLFENSGVTRIPVSEHLFARREFRCQARIPVSEHLFGENSGVRASFRERRIPVSVVYAALRHPE